jgi:hypothetical protein
MLAPSLQLDGGGDTMLRTVFVVLPLGIALVGVASGAAAISAARGPGMGMGTPTAIRRKAFKGYYDGH